MKKVTPDDEIIELVDIYHCLERSSRNELLGFARGLEKETPEQSVDYARDKDGIMRRVEA